MRCAIPMIEAMVRIDARDRLQAASLLRMVAKALDFSGLEAKLSGEEGSKEGRGGGKGWEEGIRRKRHLLGRRRRQVCRSRTFVQRPTRQRLTRRDGEWRPERRRHCPSAMLAAISALLRGHRAGEEPWRNSLSQARRSRSGSSSSARTAKRSRCPTISPALAPAAARATSPRATRGRPISRSPATF